MSLPPIECAYVTDEFMRQLKNSNDSTFKFPFPVPLLRFLYELSWSLVCGSLPLQKCKAALDAVDFSDVDSDEELGSCFADIITQMALDLTMSSDNRTRLIKVARWAVESSLVPVTFFQERCEEEFLWECEMVKIKAQDLKSKEVRVNTRLLYQQTKFNLLREESEGYAKLVTLLCDCSGASHSSSSTIIGTIKSLIGYFDLDPNRVFDIVLECFEMQPHNDLFLDLIPIFSKSHASQILGLKFQYHQSIEVQTAVPSGLYRLTALLIKEGFIELDNIFAHLLPKDEEAFENFDAISTKRLDEANKIGKINLAATGKDLMDDEKPGDVTIDLYGALDLEKEVVIELSTDLESSQPLGLLVGFLYVDDWNHANVLFKRLAPLAPVANLQVCSGLFRLIKNSISSAYDIIRKRHNQISRQVHEALDSTNSVSSGSTILLSKDLFEMLACAGPYLYRDTLLLQKVCRVLKAYYCSALELNNKGDGAPIAVGSANITSRMHLREARSRIEEALGTCLLPSLQLVPANPAVGQEIWEVMSLLPYEVRYRLYGEWEKDDERIPMILSARQIAKLDTRRILKRLAKENLKQLGRMVAKLAHANPLTVIRTIVQQIEAYRDMITPVVDAFKYLTQMEYDVLEYVVIERLTHMGRAKLKDDGLNLSDWLQYLALFWGHLCKKYPSMELRGLFQYLINHLKRGQGTELILLQELIQQMANVQYTENMTEEQLDFMAGGETLRSLATSFGISRNNKALIKSTNRLRDSLLPKEEPNLAIPLLQLIAQYRSVVVINANAPYIKMVCEQLDRCHGILLQYVEFLCSAVSSTTAYAQLIPSLYDLVHLYHLDAEVAFLIFRPVMRLSKCLSGSVSWPMCDVETGMLKESEPTGDSASVCDLGSQKLLRWSDLLDTIRTMLPSKSWNSLSPDLYATFWGLTLYDLYVPRNGYESEIAKQHAALKALEQLSDNSSSAIAKRKKEKERIQESMDRLKSELQKHDDHVSSVGRRLAKEKDNWLSSCPDTLKINMEFLQRCIFPRCTFSMPDAIYCAIFVQTLHSLGTPYFNTVNHIDVLICKTLHPMVCCCTEYEAGRLGRFLYETLKTAYYWKSTESVYERECGNMPGFAVYYRDPNSQRITYGQFIKVHWKWSQKLTRLLIQCLESVEYMEIRNALILLTKISSVFPVARKSGMNIEKRVAKIKSDEREDLKVLATSVAAALAARKGHNDNTNGVKGAFISAYMDLLMNMSEWSAQSSWVTEDEFGMGYIELKPAQSVGLKTLAGNGLASSVSQNEVLVGGVVGEAQPLDSVISNKDQNFRMTSGDGRLERPESGSGIARLKGSNGGEGQSSGTVGVSRSFDSQRILEELPCKTIDENIAKQLPKTTEIEPRASAKRALPGAGSKAPKLDAKDEFKLVKASARASGVFGAEKDYSPHATETRQMGTVNVHSESVLNGSSGLSKTEGMSGKLVVDVNELRDYGGTTKSSDLRGLLLDDVIDQSDTHRAPHRSGHSPMHDFAGKSIAKEQKRASPAEDPDRSHKRRKNDSEIRDVDVDIDRERILEQRATEKLYPSDLDKSKEKSGDKYDREHRERSDRSDKLRVDDISSAKSRDKSMERYGRERSLERVSERRTDRTLDGLTEKLRDDRSKDERGKLRHNESSNDKSHGDDRFHSKNLPPPPPLPPHVVPQSVNANRRDDDFDRRFVSGRHAQRLSPRHEEKERRRSEETFLTAQDDPKRRREDELRDRKREERDTLLSKADDRDREKERERERGRENLLKEEMDLNITTKRRKLKREHIPGGEPGEHSPVATAPPMPIGILQQYDGRERGDRKASITQRPGYFEEPGMRMHMKEPVGKIARRDIEPMYDREWDDEKRQKAEAKRRHRK